MQTDNQPAKKQKTDEVDTMGVSEMKAIIKSAGLSSADCVEKSDLRVRCREAQERLAEAERLRSAAAQAPAAPPTAAPPAPAPAPASAQPAAIASRRNPRRRRKHPEGLPAPRVRRRVGPRFRGPE